MNESTSITAARALFDEPVPRAATTVDAHVRQVAAGGSRVIRVLALAFGALTVFTGLVLVMFGIADGGIADALTFLLPLAVFGGLMPVLAVRWLLDRDAKAARRLVRSGTAHSGLIANHGRDMHGAIHLIDVVWREDGRDVAAHFDIDSIELTGGEEIVILAARRSRAVVGVFGNKGTFVGTRRSIRDAA